MDGADIIQCTGICPLLLMAVQSFQKGCDGGDGVMLRGVVELITGLQLADWILN